MFPSQLRYGFLLRRATVDCLNSFKSIVSVVGHVWGGQEASDVIPPLVVAGATVTLLSAKDGSSRTLPVPHFVKGGNQVDLHPDEVLATVHIQPTSSLFLVSFMFSSVDLTLARYSIQQRS